MKEIKTEIIINTKPEKVWEVLTDFKKYPTWNPFIQNISGEQKVGSKLDVSIHPLEGNGMTFQPTLFKFEENREFRWVGKLLVKGIFDGEHYFVLSKEVENKTKFTHGEKFRGILVYFAGKILDKTKGGFELMNESLKVECEKDEHYN